MITVAYTIKITAATQADIDHVLDDMEFRYTLGEDDFAVIDPERPRTDKQKLADLVALLGVDIGEEIKSVPDAACRPIFYSLGTELANIIADL